MLSLDLFSGIGGITYALDGYAKPHMYCDIDKSARECLISNMQRGMLPHASIANDVRDIHEVPRSVNAIVGGSPCQSISAMGNREGIRADTKSGMFYEIVRIVEENPHIVVLFLENVENILRVGLLEVVQSLSRLGFSLSWNIKSACDYGAPHKRARWFCLAVKDGAEVPELTNFIVVDKGLPTWSRDNEPPRVAIKPQYGRDPRFDPHWSCRQRLLGNSVVPSVVRGAFEELATSYKKWPSIGSLMGDMSTHFTQWKGIFPARALVWNGQVVPLPSAGTVPKEAYIPSITLDKRGTLVSVSSFSTPRAGNVRASRSGDRVGLDCGSTMVHCLESQIYVASTGLRVSGDGPERMFDVCTPCTNYVEWVMGYPENWTRFAANGAIDGNGDDASGGGGDTSMAETDTAEDWTSGQSDDA